MSTSGRSLEAQLSEAVSIRELLKRNTEETEGILRALNGEYILPEAGGDLLRDGAGVLPTGGSPTAVFPCIGLQQWAANLAWDQQLADCGSHRCKEDLKQSKKSPPLVIGYSRPSQLLSPLFPFCWLWP